MAKLAIEGDAGTQRIDRRQHHAVLVDVQMIAVDAVEIDVGALPRGGPLSPQKVMELPRPISSAS